MSAELAQFFLNGMNRGSEESHRDKKSASEQMQKLISNQFAINDTLREIADTLKHIEVHIVQKSQSDA